MKEAYLPKENLNLVDKVNVALNRVDSFTEEVAAEMGEQWSLDRFGEYKSEHMIKMANESDETIRNYELDKKEEIKEYLPLFKFVCRSHDLGRHFHDDKRYVDEQGKFLDHGEIGVLLLKEKGIMNNFSDNEQKLVNYVIKNHSLQETEKPTDEVEEKALIFCNIFRDMDKLEVLNKRDFVMAKEIYRLLGIHFDLGEFRELWKVTDEREKYIGEIDVLLQNREPKIDDGLGERIREIVNGPMEEVVGDINIIDSFEKGVSMPQSVYKESGSYANYILFLMSFLNGIKWSRTIIDVDSEEIQTKMDFLKNRTAEDQYQRIRAVLNNRYGYEIN